MVELDLLDEAESCATSGVQFICFPIPDRDIPASFSETLTLVRQLVACLGQGKSVGVHCRQGVGRSAMITACVLAAFGEGSDAAFERIARARGRPVPDTAEQREWVKTFVDGFSKTKALNELPETDF